MNIAQYRGSVVQDEPVFFDDGVGDALAFLWLQGALTGAEVEVYVAVWAKSD